MPERGTSIRLALLWLVHPVTCAALLLLVVNDHVLKAAYGSWWTGKLSDVAWLVVAPPLLGVVVTLALAATRGGRRPHAGTSRLPAACVAVVGVVFVAAKTIPVGAAVASSILTALAGHSVVLADQTDLLALPALAVAWATSRSRGGSSHAGGAAVHPARWMVVLPLAVVATAATSAPHGESVTQVFVIDGVLVAEGSISADGVSWEQLTGPREVALSDRVDELAAVPRDERPSACTEDGQVCFRPVEHGLGVQRSDDAGATWQTEWSVEEDVVAELADRYSPRANIWTADVAVLTTDDGFVVVAANAEDGLAVRLGDGTWDRVGFAFQASPPPVVPLPGDATQLDYPVPWPLLGAAAGAAVVLVAAGRRTGGRPDVGSAQPVWAAAALALASAVNLSSGIVVGQVRQSTVILLPPFEEVAVGTLLVVAVGLLVTSAARVERRHALTPMVVVACGVAAAWGLLRSQVLVGVAVTVLVVVGAAAARVTPDRVGERVPPPPSA
ncbi:MAG TPA: hypothetical protein VGK35_07480 [Actinotalea sp.]|jgi:hypothetical protein